MENAVVGLVILVIGLVACMIYLFSERNHHLAVIQDFEDSYQQLMSDHEELKSFANALDEENAELYRQLHTSDSEGSALAEQENVNSTLSKKPCCTCDRGVYNPGACIMCGPENNYENYIPMQL